MDKKLLKKVARRIKSLRKKKNYTQDDLSFFSNLPRSTIGNLETASNDVTLSKANQIATAFNLSLSEFLNFKN